MNKTQPETPEIQTTPTSRPGRRIGRVSWVILALPYLGLCFPRLYARVTPALLGFPFFYWYQFAWVVVTSCLLWVVYLSQREPE